MKTNNHYEAAALLAEGHILESITPSAPGKRHSLVFTFRDNDLLTDDLAQYKANPEWNRFVAAMRNIKIEIRRYNDAKRAAAKADKIIDKLGGNVINEHT